MPDRSSVYTCYTGANGWNAELRPYFRTSYDISYASDWSRWPSRPIRSLRCIVTCTRIRALNRSKWERNQQHFRTLRLGGDEYFRQYEVVWCFFKKSLVKSLTLKNNIGIPCHCMVAILRESWTLHALITYSSTVSLLDTDMNRYAVPGGPECKVLRLPYMQSYMMK